VIPRKRTYVVDADDSDLSSIEQEMEEDTETTDLDYIHKLGEGTLPFRAPKTAEDPVAVELGIELGFLAANLMFLVGSTCFFTWCDDGTVRCGVRLFIIGSLLGTVLSGWQLLESIKHLHASDITDKRPYHNTSRSRDSLLDAGYAARP